MRAKRFVQLRNGVSRRTMYSTHRWLNMTSPEPLLETITATHCASASISVRVRSHSCDSLQCNSVKSGFNQSGRNATSHPYPRSSAAAGAALSDWSVWHGNHFQNPKKKTGPPKTGGGLEAGGGAWPLRYPFRLLVLKSPIARSISLNDFKIKHAFP